MSLRRTAAAVVPAVLLACLAGCVEVPSSGPIRSGAQAPVADVAQPLVRPIATPPRPGMDPVEIVAGFLDAASAVGDDFAVARQYLAPAAQATWDPGAGVTVTAAASPQLSGSGRTVSADYTLVGTISPSGVYDVVDPVPSSRLIALTEVGGQWRIADPPPGLLLGREEVARGFVARNAYFIDPTGRWAVPDARVVPLTGPQALATALVGALLAGPSDGVADSVVTAIPSGLQLALGAVPVSDGVARVELAGPQPSLDDAGAGLFGAQFAWTLRQVPGVDAFDVYVDGRPLPLAGRRGPVPLSDYADYDPDVLPDGPALYGLDAAGGPVSVDGDAGQAVPVPMTGPDGAPVALSSVAVSPTSPLLAGASPDRSAMLIGRIDSSGQTQVIQGPVGSRPAIDGQGRVWWTDQAGQVVVAVSDGAGRFSAAVVPVTGAPGGVGLVRPSRDGTRAVVLIGSAGSASPYLAAVVPQPSGVQLQGLRPLGARTGVADASWRSADQLILLTPSAAVVERVDLLGGAVGAFAVPAATRTITGAPGVPVVIGLDDGTAGRLTGNGVRMIEGLGVPAYPG